MAETLGQVQARIRQMRRNEGIYNKPGFKGKRKADAIAAQQSKLNKLGGGSKSKGNRKRGTTTANKQAGKVRYRYRRVNKTPLAAKVALWGLGIGVALLAVFGVPVTIKGRKSTLFRHIKPTNSDGK